MSIEDSKLKEAFGRVLYRERDALGFSQETLSDIIGSHFTHISRLENGHKQPTLLMFFKLAESLKITPEALIVKVQEELNR